MIPRGLRSKDPIQYIQTVGAQPAAEIILKEKIKVTYAAAGKISVENLRLFLEILVD